MSRTDARQSLTVIFAWLFPGVGARWAVAWLFITPESLEPGSGGAEREREVGKKRLFTQIAALSVCNQRAGEICSEILAVFSLFTLCQGLPECGWAWGAGGGSSASLEQWLCEPVMASRTQTLTAKEKESPGPGWGCSSGHSCSAQIQRRASQVARGQRVLPGQQEGEAHTLGQIWTLPGPCLRFLPSVTTKLHVLLLTPQSWSSEIATNHSENGVLFCLVNTFTFYERAGAQLLNAHVFAIPWCLAVLWDCPQPPL